MTSSNFFIREDNIVKKGIRLTKNSLIALYVMFVLLGGSLAVLTYFKYTYIARAFVGFAIYYLILNHNRLHNQDGSIEELLLRPGKIKDFITVFIGSLICTWAGMQIVEAILFYLKK